MGENDLCVLELLSRFLNERADCIPKDAVEETARECGVSREYAYALLLAVYCGLDMDRSKRDMSLFRQYFLPMVKEMDGEMYSRNPYMKAVRFPKAARGAFEAARQSYAPYEAFVRDDLQTMPGGRVIPQIGYFPEGFSFPAVLENGRIWMTVTPNEIETMRAPIGRARGQVLTYGLGLGYFAFMAAGKEAVTSLTVVEKSRDAIELFQEYILPQFPCRRKIKIVQEDAFRYARRHMRGYDFVFTDLWHDVSDGMELYLKMKAYEGLCPQAEYAYWIEKSIRCYLA